MPEEWAGTNGQFKMANDGDLQSLQKLVIGKIENFCSSLTNSSKVPDVKIALEKIDQITEGFHCLDSLMTLMLRNAR